MRQGFHRESAELILGYKPSNPSTTHLMDPLTFFTNLELGNNLVMAQLINSKTTTIAIGIKYAKSSYIIDYPITRINYESKINFI
jgi:hypothetical protein